MCDNSVSRTWPLEATAVDKDTQLRGSTANAESLRRIEDEECIGGMAWAARAVAALPGKLVIGGQVSKILDCFVRILPRGLRLHSCDRVGGDGC